MDTMTPNYAQSFQDILGGLKGQVDQYAEELIKQAQGDYDFAAKWIEANYKQALGTDDQQRKDFFKEVANALEQRVGRVVFDYQTNKYRTEQDITTQTTRVNEDTQRALQRLTEDEQVYKEQQAEQNEQDRSAQDTSLNARGLVSAPRSQAVGLQGQEVGRLEQDIADRMSSFERQLGRQRQDITTSSTRQLTDIGTQGQRSLEDITTQARRSGEEAQTSYDYNVQKAERLLAAAKAEAEKARRSGYGTAATLADYINKGLYFQ